MGALGRDIRYALRQIKRSPGYAFVTVLILTLGIGANTAIFTVLNALLLRTLPVRNPEQLVDISPIYRNGSKVPISYPTFQLLEQNQRVFSGMFAWTGSTRRNVEIDGALCFCMVRGVTGNYYGELGAAPLLGRLAGPDDADSAASVAVIDYEYWQRRFGGDPGVIGKLIRIDGEPFTIIGVSRKWFTGMTPGLAPEVTIPITASTFARNMTNRALLWLFVGARLKDRITLEQAREQLGSFWQQALAQTAPTAVAGPRLQSWLEMRLEVNSASRGIGRDLRSHFERNLQMLMGASVLILLVACVNLAGLNLARAAVRSHEISVRMSLGATRLHIIRQLLTESALLSAAGALCALALADASAHLLILVMVGGVGTPVMLNLNPDWHVFSYAALVAGGAAVLIALAPAWQAIRQQPSLQSNKRTLTGATRVGKGLIVTEIALSFVLLLGAGLLLRSFSKLRSVDPEFQTSDVLQLILHRQPGKSAALDLNSYRQQLLNSITSMPGVVSAGFGGLEVPEGDSGWRDTVSASSGGSAADSTHFATLVSVSPGFFRTLGIPLIAGRRFDWSDNEQHPRVAIVDANLARQLAPSGNALGMRVRFGVQPDFRELQIIGIVHRARLIDLRDPSAPVLYVPSPQQPQFDHNLFIRAINPGTVVREVEKEVQAHGQEYSVSTRTLAQNSEQALTEDRAIAMLSSLFAGLGLVLAGVGLFGLMAYTVSRRTREIGIRMALGSQRAGILRLILGESIMLTLLGIMIGVPCAWAATRFITHILFGVKPGDPVTTLVSAGALLATGAIGGYWPARRALAIDPMIALRAE